MLSNLFWRQFSSDINSHKIPPPHQYLELSNNILRIANSDLGLPGTVFSLLAHLFSVPFLTPVNIRFTRFPNISTQVTFWEMIAVQFESKFKTEIVWNKTKNLGCLLIYHTYWKTTIRATVTFWKGSDKTFDLWKHQTVQLLKWLLHLLVTQTAKFCMHIMFNCSYRRQSLSWTSS